jgi:hypothetical protein
MQRKCHIPKDGILHSHRLETLKSYNIETALELVKRAIIPLHVPTEATQWRTPQATHTPISPLYTSLANKLHDKIRTTETTHQIKTANLQLDNFLFQTDKGGKNLDGKRFWGRLPMNTADLMFDISNDMNADTDSKSCVKLYPQTWVTKTFCSSMGEQFQFYSDNDCIYLTYEQNDRPPTSQNRNFLSRKQQAKSTVLKYKM